MSYGKATSYLPVIDLLKGYLRIHDGDMHRDMREKLVGKLMVLDETLRSLQPAFLSLLGVPVQDDKWEQLDPVHRRQRTLEACRRLLLRESEVQPLVLVFEICTGSTRRARRSSMGSLRAYPLQRFCF